MCAKPVIDILLGAESIPAIEQHAPSLAALGYVYRPEYEAALPDRRYFVRPSTDGPKVHLHAVVLGGLFWQRHLAFRDALRAHSKLALDYAALKRGLASVHRKDKAAHTEAKGPFIAQVLAGFPDAGTEKG